LNIFYGNNLEQLLKSNLIEEIKRSPLPDPIQKEIIIVQNQGMTIWLKQFFAREFGISCNFAFPFINGFINDTLEQCLENPPDKDFFHPYTMAWKIWSILPTISKKYHDLANYLQNDYDGIKQYQLASRIANCYDHYQIYRPELILKDFDGIEHFLWQQEIWEKISKGKTNRSDAFKKFIDRDNSQYLSKIKRISIVGIFSMPPMFIEFFRHLSDYMEVNIYLPTPGNLLDNSNPFIETLGKAGSDFFKLLQEKNATFCPHIVENNENSILNTFHRSLRTETVAKSSKVHIEEVPSIQFHNCHSRMREVEVLKNNILHLIDKKEIKPSEILVMMPNITDYSPYIKSVFNRNDILSKKETNQIAYSMTDNSISFSTGVDEVFLKLLELHKSRFEASTLLYFLEKEIIYKKFGLEPTDVELIRNWIANTNIRWGINGTQREEEFDLIKFEENSWEKGLNRMFLGFCLKDEDYPKLHYSHLPYDNFEGHNNFILGKLSHFISLLENIHNEFSSPTKIEIWQQRLMQLISDLFYDRDEYQQDLHLLREKISKLMKITELAKVRNDVSIGILQQYFLENLQDEFQTRRYFRGGITFSTMQPLRNIPAKVVCILGMNDNEFPRSEHFDAFNLLGKERKVGDRIKREEDQYLFLEAVLSAQNYLIISYLGQDIRSNEKSEPASPVCELRDYLAKIFQPEIMNRIQYQHKLQSHNPVYFDPQHPDYMNYSKLDFPKNIEPLTTNSEIDAKIEIEEIYLEDLIRDLSNPSQFFVEKILGAKLKSWDIEIKDSENFNLDNLETYKINDIIKSLIIKGNTPEFIYDILKAQDSLPVGLKGKQDFENFYNDLNNFLQTEIVYLNDQTLLNLLEQSETKSVDFQLDNFRIFGKLPPQVDQNLIINRYASFKGKDALKSWLYHLAASIAIGDVETICFSKEKTLKIFPKLSKETAEEELRNILNLFKTAHTHPLPFFPNSSLQFLIKKPTKSMSKIDSAISKWTSSNFTFGDSEDPYFSLFFDEKSLQSLEFQEIAFSLLSPFANHFDKMPVYKIQEESL